MCRQAWPRGQARREHVDAGHPPSGDLLEPALGRAERFGRHMPVPPVPVHSQTVIATLIDRPLEFTQQPGCDALAFHRLDLGVGGGDLGASGEPHAAHLDTQPGCELLETEVEVAQIELSAVGPATVAVVGGTHTKPARTDGTGREATELHILHGAEKLVAPGLTSDTELQPVGDVPVVGVAATRVWLEEAPRLGPGPVPDEQAGVTRCTSRARLLCVRRGGHPARETDGDEQTGATAAQGGCLPGELRRWLSTHCHCDGGNCHKEQSTISECWRTRCRPMLAVRVRLQDPSAVRRVA